MSPSIRGASSGPDPPVGGDAGNDSTLVGLSMPRQLRFSVRMPASPPTGGSGPDDAPRMLGDIAIAYETTRKEADDEQKPFDHHLSHLAVHGFLHLIGYDHENDDDAEAMESLETEILAQLGIPDPYADRERTD